MSIQDWVTSISPDTAVLIVGGLLSWLGISKSNKGKRSLRKLALAELRRMFEQDILPNQQLHSRAAQWLEANIWVLLTEKFKVKKTPGREQLVDELISELISQMGPLLMRHALQHLATEVGKVPQAMTAKGEIPKLGLSVTIEQPKPEPEPLPPAPQEPG